MGLLLPLGEVWRTRDGAITVAGCPLQCSFTPGSLGWLGYEKKEMGGDWGEGLNVNRWVNRISGSHGEVSFQCKANTLQCNCSNNLVKARDLG